MVLAKGCLTFKTAWGGEEVGNQDYSVFRLFVFNVRLEDDLSVVPWIMIDCRYPLSSSPWIRLIVPFGVRNSTLPVFGACEFFFGPPLPVFAANAGIGTKSSPAVNWRNSPEGDAEDARSFA